MNSYGPCPCLPNSEKTRLKFAPPRNAYELHYRQGLAENTANGSRPFRHSLQYRARERFGWRPLVPVTFLLKDFKMLYLKLARNPPFRFLTYLYGAAPLAEAGFWMSQLRLLFVHPEIAYHGYVDTTSISMSFLPLVMSRTSKPVESGNLGAEKEFTSPVRFRGQNEIEIIWNKALLTWNCAVSTSTFLTLWASARKPLNTVHLFSWLYCGWMIDSDTQLQAAHAQRCCCQPSPLDRSYLAEADSSAILRFRWKMSFSISIFLPPTVN